MIVSVRNGCVEFVSNYEQKGAEKNWDVMALLKSLFFKVKCRLSNPF